jgi:hypothetical protein
MTSGPSDERGGNAASRCSQADIPPAKRQPDSGVPAAASTASEISAFLDRVNTLAPAATGSGRLIFALDATLSRQPTWDMACSLQADMFTEAGAIGGLVIRLVYYRGLSECRASNWVADATRLAALMNRIRCEGGNTQIGKVLADARREAAAGQVRALVFVGDAMEEKLDALCAKAGELGLLQVPCFMFLEGNDPVAEKAFREIARLTGGAFCRFDTGAAAQLRDLLRAVAAYAAGGRKALLQLARASSGASALLTQLRP